MRFFLLCYKVLQQSRYCRSISIHGTQWWSGVSQFYARKIRKKACKRLQDDICDVPGIRVGHDTDLEAATGCTVVVCDTPAVGGVAVRGGAAVTHETDLLRPLYMVNVVHAVVLTGGSVFGLQSVSGVMRYLEERAIGYNTLVARVPIVPAAAIFDLAIGSPLVRPNSASGYRACAQASSGPVAQGNVGGGTGATIGSSHRPPFSIKAGLGSASTQLPDGTIVGALVVVNALGNVVDPQTQQVIAAGRSLTYPLAEEPPHFLENSTIAVIATNAPLSKEAINKVAHMAHNGLALAVHPAHTMFDGDTIFALALGAASRHPRRSAESARHINRVGMAAAETLARAIVKAIQHAHELHNVPAADSLLVTQQMPPLML